MTKARAVLVTGGAGYIGSRLIPKLLSAGHCVRVLDAMLFGNGLEGWSEHERLEILKGDIRDRRAITEAIKGAHTVVHLAAVANDPSFELNPSLSRSINYDSLPFLFEQARGQGVSRFIYASSASVYGISGSPAVDEQQPLVPLTDYNKFKALGEELLFADARPGFETVAVRAATVCGSSPRQRLDLTVNILTMQALRHRKICVFGGCQYRPNIHVADVSRFYSLLVNLESFTKELDGAAINVGNENAPVADIAKLVQAIVQDYLGNSVAIEQIATDDKRSYRLDASRARKLLGFVPIFTIADAVKELCEDWANGRFCNHDPLNDARFHNIKGMRAASEALL